MSRHNLRQWSRCFVALLVTTVAGQLAAADAPPALKVINRVRFLAAPKAEQALVGGVFSGSNTSPTAGYEVLGKITAAPEPGQWGELSFSNERPYRWIRYAAPAGSFGKISKLEFFAGEEKLAGQLIAPPFGKNQWSSVLNDAPNQGVKGATADGQYVGLDLGDKAATARPTIGPVNSPFSKPTTVTMQCKTPGAVIRYTTDGTPPALDNGQVYSAPLTLEKTTTLRAAAFADGLAPSPDNEAILLFEPVGRRTTLHFGNSLTGNAVGRFSDYVRTTGVIHETKNFLMGGGITRALWDVAMVYPTDPKDEAQWKSLYSNTKSMGGEGTYPPANVEGSHKSWEAMWPALTGVSDLTFQPRDADIPEEVDYEVRWLKFVREKFPDVQPWLYIEWTEMQRQRATDKGKVPSSQMHTLYPAITWEESMSAMLLYGEEVQHVLKQAYQEGKPARIIPVALAMGWIHDQIEKGRFPGVGKDDFYPFLFGDGVHLNLEGSYLVDAVWYAALYRQSPEGKLLPSRLQLTPEQARAMQRLAWDVVQNYPDCGLYAEGSEPVGKPEFSLSPADIKQVTRVELKSPTPGAWFRYTLDGTEPTRTRGYIYCGAISVRPGMTVKAVAYRSGMADSPVSAATYPESK